MHIANAAMEYLAYTPSTKHFGQSNTQLIGDIVLFIAFVVAISLFGGKKK
jgi:hypothetical protein